MVVSKLHTYKNQMDGEISLDVVGPIYLRKKEITPCEIVDQSEFCAMLCTCTVEYYAYGLNWKPGKECGEYIHMYEDGF